MEYVLLNILNVICVEYVEVHRLGMFGSIMVFSWICLSCISHSFYGYRAEGNMLVQHIFTFPVHVEF